MKIRVSCCLCDNHIDLKAELPEGWSTHIDSDDIEDGFCPEHAPVKGWAENQCPGCVGGWTDCSLWEAFAHRGHRTLTEGDLGKIRSGICPRRTNGTFVLRQREGSLSELSLAKQAPFASGEAFFRAIKDYWRRYE